MSKLAAWIDERTAWRTRARAWIDHPVIGGAPWASAICASVVACFGVLALTGVLLMTAYAPSPQTAWASVFYVEHVLSRGWIIRGLHFWAAQSLLVLAALHIAHGALAASYRKPREVAWWLTLLVLGLVVAEGITGGLLPWDQRGWWARVVEGNIVGLAPGIGGWVQAMLEGGPELGALGLTRMYALHVAVLPLIVAVVLLARRSITSRHGWGSGGTEVPQGRALARSTIVAVVVVLALFALTGWAHGAPLEGPADPLSDYPARPEWFLMPLYQLRKLFHGPLAEFMGTSLVPAIAAAYFALLPWIDRPGRPRAIVVYAPLAAVAAGTVALAGAAWQKDAHDRLYAKSRADADRVAAAAMQLAMQGVPPAGALEMVRNDPELRGRSLFAQHCASCHVLGDLGDPKKTTAAKLDGWGTTEWIVAMIHDPDAPQFFGLGPYKGKMPSVEQRPKDKPADEPWTPMIKSDAEKAAVAAFLALQGDEPGDPPRATDAARLAQGEKIVSDRCTTCHLYKGDGDLESSGIAPELAHYGSIAWTRSQVANPATDQTYRDQALDPAMKKHMPRFDKDLSPADVDVVARWTRAHGRGQTLP
jgi:ubiquinol-cytochrome c reductase cytochrome b subunit